MHEGKFTTSKQYGEQRVLVASFLLHFSMLFFHYLVSSWLHCKKHKSNDGWGAGYISQRIPNLLERSFTHETIQNYAQEHNHTVTKEESAKVVTGNTVL